MLELGTFKGATTIQLIRALPFAGEPRVVTVDCLDGRSPALRRLDAFYSFVPGQDIDLVPALDGSFDFVYLDTLHNYEHTKAQVAVVRAHHPSAVIAVHDILSHAGVSQALAEFASAYEVLFHAPEIRSQRGPRSPQREAKIPCGITPVICETLH
jgi:predicted O-methyltransferase YrrM